MKCLLSGLALVMCACSPFEAPVDGPLPYGGVKAYVVTTRHRVDPSGSDGISVALDSAIQGYGVQPILASLDSAMFNPVIIGEHETALRGVGPNCVIVGGPSRTFRVESAQAVVFTYVVNC
jgi:hypothetical protein